MLSFHNSMDSVMIIYGLLLCSVVILMLLFYILGCTINNCKRLVKLKGYRWIGSRTKKNPERSPQSKAPLGQKPPNNKKYKLMLFCFIYIFLLCLCLTVWICKIFFILYNMIQDFFNLCILIHLFFEHEDIINNWSICLRIIITLINESKNKNKVVFILK